MLLTLPHNPDLNALPNNNFLDQIIFKAFADNESNVIEIMISLLDTIEIIVGKGENATSIFSFSYHFFKRLLPRGHLKLGWCGKELHNLQEVDFGKHCGKRRKCCKPAFSPFPAHFFSILREKSSLQQLLKCCLQMLSICSCPEICCKE